ncbi:MAG: SGNH/GDSL hydrolase family protein [Clostridia bacterium]|nr:SGNH/GDSL hydrolase family protein [Clostridia bacterium]
MQSIELIDSNFKVDTELKIEGIKFYDIINPPFKVYGVFYDSGKYRRMPESIAKTVNDGVHGLHAHTAGGRVRFKTNSPYVAIHAKMPSIGKMPHIALTGSAGFDLYIDENPKKYFSTFVPPFDIQEGYESVVHFDSAQMREININFPLFSEVSALYIGISDGAEVCSPEPYKYEKPIVYYGSSITHGGCASRPGSSYESIISRRLDADYINLGFSGSARAEDEIAEYISKLPMSVFVYDYDHNAPTAEHLNKTHEKMFRTIRNSDPDLPIVLLSRPKFSLSEDEEMRLDIIKTTYNNAVNNGDTNVYLIEGKTLMQAAEYEGTVDGCHPNDLGFMSMAEGLTGVLKEILQKDS